MLGHGQHSILFDLLNRFRQDFPGIELKLHTVIRSTQSIASSPVMKISRLPPCRVLRRVVSVFKGITLSPLLFIAPRNHGELDIPDGAKNVRSNGPRYR